MSQHGIIDYLDLAWFIIREFWYIVVIILCLIGFVVLGYAVHKNNERATQEFMSACMKKYEKFECDAFLMGGSSSSIIIQQPLILR